MDAVEQYLTLQQAADVLVVHPKTIRRAISSGRLPAYRLNGRVIRLKSSDVEALLTPVPSAVDWEPGSD